MIGVFLPTAADDLIADLVVGLSEKAEERLFPLSLSFGMSEDSYAHFIEKTRDHAHCGIITYSFFGSDEITRLIRKFHDESGKLVLLNAAVSLPGVPFVKMDEYEGGCIAAHRLLDRGCRSFFCFGKYTGRTRGFMETLKAKDLAAIVIHNTATGAEELAQRCLETPSLFPLGVFAVTDRLALRFMQTFQSKSLSVGRDVLVIGYNDNILVDEFVPPLTTIHQPFRKMGRIAVEKIVNMVYGKEETSESLKPSLVARGSG
ncbi:MAG: LacI family transcriptional regulator [Kiritimatiellae bacterium]|nr:LacI family transcriptional regulator [Kiritimatiellia bacterium]